MQSIHPSPQAPSTLPQAARTSKAVYTIIETPGDKSFWLRIGWARTNRDGSFNVTLDALPVNGKLQVRDWTPRDERARRDEEPREERAPPI